MVAIRRLTAARPGGRLRKHDFACFWTAGAVSFAGSAVTRPALPLLATVTLGATAFQVGILAAAETAPLLALGLFAGVWLDRVRRRPVMMAADLGRAALLLVIPLAAWRGAPGIELLVALGALLGGALAGPIGLRGVKWLGAPLALAIIWLSPVRKLRRPPAPVWAEAEA